MEALLILILIIVALVAFGLYRVSGHRGDQSLDAAVHQTLMRQSYTREVDGRRHP